MNVKTPTIRWTNAARDELKALRAARASRIALERDLAGSSSPAQLNEIQAILARNDGADADKLRQVVDRHRAA
jgi:hypothetical protein